MSKPLKDVPGPADLRDRIIAEWERYREWRGTDAIPAELRCTSWAGDSNASPSHRRGRALDIVTDEWPDRRYLVEFAVWLAVREPSVNVIVYRKDYEPHLHVSDVGFGGGGSASAIAVNHGDAKRFTNYPRSVWGSKSEEIISELKKVSDTYPEGVETDWEYWRGVLEGGNVGEGVGGKVLAWLKAHWYWVALPLGLAVAVWLFMRFRRGGEE